MKLKLKFAQFYFYLTIYIVKSQTVDSSNSNDTSSTACTSIDSPKNASVCNKYMDRENYCCFLSEIKNQNNTLCYLYDITKYDGRYSINYKQTAYSINCGLGSSDSNNWFDSQTGKTCGMLNPTDQKNCSDSSTSSDSCCYFSYEGYKGCFWLGNKYSGTYQSQDIAFICSGFWMSRINPLFYIFLILNFIFF